MKGFRAEIKEVGSDYILKPEYWGDENTTIKEMEAFFGVHDPDVESYKIYEIQDD